MSVDNFKPPSPPSLGICVECGQEAGPRCYSDLGRREFHISGLCEVCFDEITAEPPEDPPPPKAPDEAEEFLLLMDDDV